MTIRNEHRRQIADTARQHGTRKAAEVHRVSKAAVLYILRELDVTDWHKPRRGKKAK